MYMKVLYIISFMHLQVFKLLIRLKIKHTNNKITDNR